MIISRLARGGEILIPPKLMHNSHQLKRDYTQAKTSSIVSFKRVEKSVPEQRQREAKIIVPEREVQMF